MSHIESGSSHNLGPIKCEMSFLWGLALDGMNSSRHPREPCGLGNAVFLERSNCQINAPSTSQKALESSDTDSKGVQKAHSTIYAALAFKSWEQIQSSQFQGVVPMPYALLEAFSSPLFGALLPNENRSPSYANSTSMTQLRQDVPVDKDQPSGCHTMSDCKI